MAIEIPELREFDKEKRHLIGPVMIPNRFDRHGDGFTENEVEHSCHFYNLNHFGSCDINHKFDVECIKILESYILEVDLSLNGYTLPKGTWMMKMWIDKTNVGDVIWQMLSDGELEGFSPQGPMRENKIIKE